MCAAVGEPHIIGTTEDIRRLKGQRSGGEWAPHDRSEADIALDSKPNIVHSPGIPIGMGLAAGGGSPSCADLYDRVEAAAEGLSSHFGGATVSIRYNSGGGSGGAYLQTRVVDSIGANAEVGIGAGLNPGTGELLMYVLVSGVVSNDGERHYVSAASVKDALRVVSELVPLSAVEVQAKVEAAAAEFRRNHIRLAIFAHDNEGGATVVFAENNEEGRALLERVQKSRSKLNRPMQREPSVVEIKNGSIRNRQRSWDAFPLNTPWKDATTIETNTVYRVGLDRGTGLTTAIDLGLAVKT